MESTASLVLLIKGITNTVIRLLPIGLYSGTALSSFVFNDFRATLLFAWFMLNEFISMGYRIVLRGKENPQCALVRTENGHFTLPSPITQTVGFFCSFLLMKMYMSGQFKPLEFFVIALLLLITIWSRKNVGCSSFIDGVFSATVGMLLGAAYFSIVQDYYKQDYLNETKDTTYDDVFFKL